MIKNFVRTGCVLLALASAGCALTIDSTHLGVPATLATAAQTPPQGTAFSVTKHPIYLFLGLLPVSQPNIEDVLVGQVGAGSGVANLRVKVTSLGPVRAKLIKKGMIFSPAHGEMAFTVPLFDEFMIRAIPKFKP